SDESVTSTKLGTINTKDDSTTIQPDTNGSASVSCDSGHKAVSGGFETPPINQGDGPALLTTTAKKDGEGWEASATNLGNQPGELKVYVHCLG
ncbi:MAG: hypothetical protein JJE10_08605, partial [Thermoleophilia bacterium]|nr:hypothetical protein [Thermoleophilia bacterium]